ncbi:hypothetical protein H2201_001455 [Coniosporium apollinis]|uniref:DRBM domain-containing protein n=1 Tax=Coniosporium apollinis TaxID=61459 RepID=A0ABQ9P7Q2_9PEZI|nr:hypothetical protein H2201_001455 [Coniosporium apollinis]
MDLLDHLLVPSSPPNSSPTSVARFTQTMASALALERPPDENEPPPPSSTGLANVFSIEEFERQHAEQRAQIDAELAARRKRTAPKLSSFPNGSNGSRGVPAEPQTLIPIGKPRTPGHTIAFYQLCQARGVVPSFEFPEKLGGQRFGFRLEVAGRVVEEEGPWGSKKEAKEAACERGLEVLKELQNMNGVASWGAGTQGGSAGAAGGQDELFDPATGKPWIGLLLEFCAATQTPQPVYQEYALGQRFACTCTLNLPPSTGACSIDSLIGDVQGPRTFGSLSTIFTSKKTARANSAREAVEWLRQNGHLSETEPPRKKAKVSNPVIAAAVGSDPSAGNTNNNDSSTGNNTTTAVAKASDSTAANTATSTSHDNNTNTSNGSTGLTAQSSESYGALVNNLCASLGLQMPEYRLTNSTDVPGFWSGAAYIGREPSLQGIAPIRHVFGKKRAKEECAKGVWEVLRGWKREGA